MAMSSPALMMVVMRGSASLRAVMFAMPAMHHGMATGDGEQRQRSGAKNEVQPECVIQREMDHFRMNIRTLGRNPAKRVEDHVNKKRRNHHRRVEYGRDIGSHFPAEITAV